MNQCPQSQQDSTPIQLHKQRLNRRAFLGAASLSLGLTILSRESVDCVAASAAPSGYIDVNLSLSHWPLRRLPSEDLPAWIARLRSQGVIQGWVGSFDGLMHKNIAAVNARLFEACQKHARNFLHPFGSINPMLPDWEDDLRRCVEEHHMPGIRLHPNYHGYTIDHPAFGRLLQLASERHLIVQLALLMEDERMMHTRFRVPPLNITPLAKLVKTTPGLRLILLNALSILRGDALGQVLDAGNVYVEISMLEGVGGLGNLLAKAPTERILFGSHSPLFYFESAVLKLKESALTPDQMQAICQTNAERIFG